METQNGKIAYFREMGDDLGKIVVQPMSSHMARAGRNWKVVHNGTQLTTFDSLDASLGFADALVQRLTQ